MPEQRVAALRRLVALAAAGAGQPADAGRLLLPGPRPLVRTGPFPEQGSGEGRRLRADRGRAEDHAGAEGLLGFFLSRGIGGKTDPAAAVGWWRKGAAQGHADSLNALAAAYESGEGVAADRQEAVRLYRQAAERGSKEAQQRLAALGPSKAAAAGQAEFDEGARRHKAGQHAAAASQFLRAAELGHARARPADRVPVQLRRGRGRERGRGGEVGPRAAGQDDATAQSNLGSMYERGTGVREDWVEAARWYTRSAAQDHASGPVQPGARLPVRDRGAAEPQLAVEWFQKASFQGHAQARFFAQHLLSRGNFIGFRDRREAHVIAGKLRTGLLWEEPVGMLFHNSGERLAYIKNLRYRVDRYEAYQAWVLRRNEYDDCKRQNRSSCSDPGPAPQ